MWNLKKPELIDTENRLMGWLPEVGGREWAKWMKVVNRCKLLAIRYHSPTLTSIHDHWKNLSLD